MQLLAPNVHVHICWQMPPFVLFQDMEGLGQLPPHDEEVLLDEAKARKGGLAMGHVDAGADTCGAWGHPATMLPFSSGLS